MKNLLRTTPGTGIAAFEKWGDEDVQLNQKYVGYLMIRNDYIGNNCKSELCKPNPKRVCCLEFQIYVSSLQVPADKRFSS